jgi:hypothetical protein
MESIETVIVLFIAGLTILLIGIYKNTQLVQLRKTGIRVEGIIFQVINSGGGDSYFPVVRFTTNANDTVTQKYKISTNWWSYKEGQNVQVIYDPINPGNFIIDDGLGKTVGPGFVWGGIALIIISVGLLILGLRS